MRKTSLVGCKFEIGKFARSGWLKGTTLSGAEWPGQDLTGAQLQGCDLENCNLSQVQRLLLSCETSGVFAQGKLQRRESDACKPERLQDECSRSDVVQVR